MKNVLDPHSKKRVAMQDDEFDLLRETNSPDGLGFQEEEGVGAVYYDGETSEAFDDCTWDIEDKAKFARIVLDMSDVQVMRMLPDDEPIQWNGHPEEGGTPDMDSARTSLLCLLCNGECGVREKVAAYFGEAKFFLMEHIR